MGKEKGGCPGEHVQLFMWRKIMAISSKHINDAGTTFVTILVRISHASQFLKELLWLDFPIYHEINFIELIMW